MRIFTRGITVFLGLAASGLLVSEAQAVPAFARQTGMACTSCHAQNFPALNSFGRVFKAQGYTMRGAAPLVEGDDLSIPAELKASVIAKVRYRLGEDDDGSRGEIQWPDEAALLVGGRASEKVGFLMELGLGPQEGEGTFHLADTNGDGVIDELDEQEVASDVTGNFLSAKFHFNVTDSLAAVVFGTDGLGIGYGFELLNTGIHRSQRPIENRTGFSAYQTVGLGSGAATGIALAYHKANYYVNYSHWAPTFGNVNANIAGGLAHYVRAVYMPNIAGWDTGFGVSYLDGSIDTGPTDPAAVVDLSGWGVDAQAMGTVGSMPLGLYASYAVAPKSTAGETNFYNSSTVDDEVGYAVLAKLGVVPNKVQLYAAYSHHDDGTATANDVTKDATIGVQYMAAQNISFELYNVSSNQDGDDYTMLEMFAAF